MAWLTGWTRRKSKIVNGSSTSQVNYQMQLTVHKGTGTDTATDIYLGTNVRDDFGDVRFTSSNGSSLLNYWIESYTSGSVATVWVQIDSIPTAGTTIYIYYDNPPQITTSSGTGTFDFFDNFEGYSIGNLNGQGGWSGVSYYQVSSANPYSGNKSVYATNNDGISATPDMYNTIPSNKNFIVTWYVYYSGGISLGIGSLYPYEGTTQITRVVNDASGQLYDSVGTLGYTLLAGRWYKFQLSIHDDNKHDIKVFDGSTQVVNLSGRSNTTNMSTGVDRLYLYHDFRFNTGYMDDISIRKYASPEPTFGASGTEETEILSWLTGWNRRKSKIVNGSTTSQVNYQMQLTVHKGTGTDTATDIYLGTNVRDDFGDVRFTKSNGSSLLNYWIESYTSGSVATVWVQIGSIPTTGTTIYVYYDYPSQTTTSNASSTFDFFDNFESYSIGNLNGQGGWTGYTYYQVSNLNPHSGTKSAYATNNDSVSSGPDIYTGITASKNFTVTWYVYYSGGISLGIGSLYPYEGTTQITRVVNDASGQLYDSVGTLGYTLLAGRWYKFQLSIHDDNKHDIKVFDGTTQVVNLSGRSNTANMTTGVDRLYLYHDFRFNTGYTDDISVRKYASPEPTFGASGTEELATCGQPSCNLIILEILSEQLSRQYPEYIDMELVSRLTEDF